MFARILLLLCVFAYGINAKELVVGTASGYAPFVSLNEKGQYEGFDIDFANALAKKMDRQIIFKDLGSMPALMIGLQQDKVDCLLWGISITEERQSSMKMIHYQGDPLKKLPLLFWKTIPTGVTSIEEVKGIICVEAGSMQDEMMRAFPNKQVKLVDGLTAGLLELRYKKVAALLTEPGPLKQALEKQPELVVLEVDLPKDKQVFGNGICVLKADLAKEISEAVEALKADGTVRCLEIKWGLS